MGNNCNLEKSEDSGSKLNKENIEQNNKDFPQNKKDNLFIENKVKITLDN